MQDTSKSWQTKSPIKHNIRYDLNNCVYCCIFLMIMIARIRKTSTWTLALASGGALRGAGASPATWTRGRVVQLGGRFWWREEPTSYDGSMGSTAYLPIHEWLIFMAIYVGRYNIHGSNGLINVTSLKRSKIWKMAVFFVGGTRTDQMPNLVRARPLEGLIYSWIWGSEYIQVRIGKSWIQDSKYLDQGLIDVDCQTIFHSLRSGDRAGYSDQSCFVAFSVVSFVIPIDLGCQRLIFTTSQVTA